MFEARRFYWILLHTSIRRLYAITIGIILLLSSTWFYFWYLPLNRTIQRLVSSSVSESVDVYTNVNITDERVSDYTQQLPQIALCANKSGMQMKRMYGQNNHLINFEGRGTIRQIISFFELIQKEYQSFTCVQMNMHKDCKDLFVVHMQLT